MKFLKKILKEENFNSLLGNLSISALGFLSFILLSRKLSQEVFGEWVIFTTAATLIDLLRFGLTRNAVITLSAGADKNTENEIAASAFANGLLLVGLITALFIPVYLLLPLHLRDGSIGMILKWYPVLALCNIGWTNGVSVLQARMKFQSILVMRSLNSGLYVLFLLILPGTFINRFGNIVVLFILTNLASSVLSFFGKFDGLPYIHKAKKTRMLQIYNYGKYSVGSFLGSSLLRSADTFIIGLAPFLGPKGVAIYSIPMKLVEIMEIPLRSFSATAFPKLSAAFSKNNLGQLKSIFYTYSGVITSIFIPVVILSFIFAPQLVLLLGGDQYFSDVRTMTLIFRIFSIYGLILPIDRMSGIMLDSLNCPEMNFRKILMMLGLNIAGDLIAVFVFGSVEYVAVATVVFTVFGAIAGWQMIRNRIGLNYKPVFTESIGFYRNMIFKIRSI